MCCRRRPWGDGEDGVRGDGGVMAWRAHAGGEGKKGGLDPPSCPQKSKFRSKTLHVQAGGIVASYLIIRLPRITAIFARGGSSRLA